MRCRYEVSAWAECCACWSLNIITPPPPPPPSLSKTELYAVFNPSIPSTYTLQPNQPFDLSCMARGSGTPRVVGYYNQSGLQTPIGKIVTQHCKWV